MDMELEQMRGEVQRMLGQIQELEQRTQDGDRELQQVRAEIARLLGHHPSDALQKLVELASEEIGDAAASIQEGADFAEPPAWTQLALDAASDYNGLRANYGQLAHLLTIIRHRAQCTDTGMGADILKMIAEAPVVQPDPLLIDMRTLLTALPFAAIPEFSGSKLSSLADRIEAEIDRRVLQAGVTAPQLTADEKQALQWALGQDFPSVAARYAKTLAKLAQRLGATA